MNQDNPKDENEITRNVNKSIEYKQLNLTAITNELNESKDPFVDNIYGSIEDQDNLHMEKTNKIQMKNSKSMKNTRINFSKNTVIKPDNMRLDIKSSVDDWGQNQSIITHE